MNSLLLIVPIAAGAFIATNLDNLALLMAFLLRYPQRKFVVANAYLSSVFLLGLAGYVAGRAGELLPVEYLGWLGLVPVALGISGVINLFREEASGSAPGDGENGSGRTAFWATLTAQLGNGADTIITFGALFADSKPAADSLIVVSFAAMAIIFLLGAHFATQHRAVAEKVEKHAARIMPFILIIVGAYILADTATDLV